MLGIDVNAWFQIIGHILQKELPEASEGKEPSGQPLSLEGSLPSEASGSSFCKI